MLITKVEDFQRFSLRLQWHSLNIELHKLFPFGGTDAKVVHGNLPQTAMTQQTAAILKNEELGQFSPVSKRVR